MVSPRARVTFHIRGFVCSSPLVVCSNGGRQPQRCRLWNTMNTPEAERDDGINVLIVAHVRLYRDGLASILAERRRFRIVGVADTCDVALQQACATATDVVMIDMSMPGALDAVAALARDVPRTRVVAFAVGEDASQIIACVEAGAAGYVTCESSIDDLVSVIESTVRGELPCSPRIAAQFARRLTELASVSEPAVGELPLTGREWQVIRLLREGLSNKEIGQSLHIAEATVKNHVHHLLEKLKVTTRRQAVARLARTRSELSSSLRA